MSVDLDLTSSPEPSPHRRTRWPAALRRWRVTISSLFGIVALLYAAPTVTLIVTGGGLMMMGMALRLWALGYLRKDTELCTAGPYAYTRNPLYLANFLLGLGLVVACGRWWLGVLFVVLFAVLYGSAMTQEAAHLRRLFPREFPPYERAVPWFWPRWRPYPASSGRYDFAMLKSHREYRLLFILGLVLALLAWKAAVGQAASRPEQATAAGPPTAPLTLPFAEGETLQFEARFSKLLLSGKIGRLTFTFGRSTEPPLVGKYHIKAEAVSEGFWTKLFRIDVKDSFESFVEPADFGVYRTRKQFNHNGKRELELAIFNRSDGSVVVIERNLSKADQAPSVKQAPAQPWVQDVVSVIYYVRTLPMTVGQTMEVPVSDSGKTYDLQINVVAHELLKTDLGSFNTVKLQPLVMGEDKIIRRPGEMFVWFTDDARRLPVKAMVAGSFGTATIELRAMSGVPEAKPGGA